MVFKVFLENRYKGYTLWKIQVFAYLVQILTWGRQFLPHASHRHESNIHKKLMKNRVKHCILQNIFTYLYCLDLWKIKSFVLKTELYFIYFYLLWGRIRSYSIKGSVFQVPFL